MIPLWDFIIEQNDKAMIFFIIIAVLQYHKESMLKLESAFLLVYISKIKITSIDELKTILSMSLEIKRKTPYSIYILINSLEIFLPQSHNLKAKYESISPQYFPAFPIYPSELLHITFPSVVSCPDVTCKNFNNNYADITWAKKSLCAKCKETKKRNIDYCLFDLRICESKEKSFENQGFLPSMKYFDQKLLNKGIEEEVIKETDNLPDEYHLILITNLTENFEMFENKLYKEKITEEETLLRKVGLLSCERKTDLEDSEVKKYLKDNKKNKNAYREIKEYDNLKSCIKQLIKTKHKYISFAYGGFKDIHCLAISLRVPLTSHSKEKCELCFKIEKQKEKKVYKSISEEKFNSLCLVHKCKSFQCAIETKNANMVITKGSIFIFLLKIAWEKEMIEYEVLHRISKYTILAIEKENTTVKMLYSYNFSQSHLNQIVINLFSEKEVDKFINEIII